MMDDLLVGLAAALEFRSILTMVGGTAIGIVIGALPGLNPVMAIALLLPITYGFEPLLALGLIAGIYNGSMYGGAIPAILLRIPGTPAAIATTFDGFPMAQQGKAGQALRIACWSSAIGGMASAVALLFFGPLLAQVTLAFGPPEYFWVAVFGLTSIGVLVGSDPLKGVLAALLGLGIGCIGIDGLTGVSRFSFGSVYLMNGFDLIVLLVGLYALPPVLQMAQDGDLRGMDRSKLAFQAQQFRLIQLVQHARTWLRSIVIGIVVGILPGAGGNIAAIIAYNETKRAARDPESYGKGNPDGVAASECANNADNAASLIPTLALGVPGNIIAALIMGALLIHGIQPGPRLFHNHPEVVYGFMVQLLLTAALLIVLGGLAATRVFAQVQRIPGVMMVPMILVLTIVGVLVVNGRVFDIYVMIGFGVLGYFFERINVPLAPIVLGVLLGPLAEQNLRRSLLIGRDDWSILVTRPISLVLVGMIVLVLLVPVMRALRARRHRA